MEYLKYNKPVNTTTKKEDTENEQVITCGEE